MSGKKAPKIRWCTYCNTEAPSGAVFCPRCGEPIDPNYVYGEGVFSEDAVNKEDENLSFGEITFTPSPLTVSGTSTQVLYEGTIRGLVTSESEMILIPVVGAFNLSMIPPPNPFIPPSNPYGGFVETFFVMRLEEGFEGVPDEILVQTSSSYALLETHSGYFGVGDKVTLQGRIFRINLRVWNRPMYAILADHFYNETLQTGDEELMKKNQILYGGEIRGSVTRESRPRVLRYETQNGIYSTSEVCFAMKLEENIEGFPEEILVRYNSVGYFGIGDRVILQGEIVKANLRQWGRPSYAINADIFYNESLRIGNEGLMEKIRESHSLMMRGSVTNESIITLDGVGNYKRTLFTMKLEEAFEEIPDKILVQTYNFGYFGKGDKVILQGRLILADLRHWNRPMYMIIADHFYNESLQFGSVGLTDRKRVLYKGMMRGSVTEESQTRIYHRGLYLSIKTYFAVRLEGNIGIEGIPDKLLVSSERAGYFRKGDKVVLQGRILEGNLRLWNKPMYLIIADHYYNESLQIGD
jgi:hypothetical protein